ncbi:MAG: ATPase [Myxococcales bacterium]|nr:ATPase [Myxococcales bacterium]
MSQKSCSVCGKSFMVRFSYQVQRTSEAISYFCSQKCQEHHLRTKSLSECSWCGKSFELLYAYQQMNLDGVTYQFCSETCRRETLDDIASRQKKMKKIAVLNQKGGTGKTTTSVNVSAALAQMGKRVLLVDFDAQSNVGVSLGLSSPRTISDVLLNDAHPADCIINVSENFDAIISSTSLSSVETDLVRVQEGRNRILSHRMTPVTNYDVVILDCSPSLNVLNLNTLTYADHILIPVSCDYLSLVGVRNIMRTLRKINEVLLSQVDVIGVVPTFYGLSEQCTMETMRSLKAFFKEKVLHPIRVDPALRQAPMHKQTIFEYAPDSKGAHDYYNLAIQLIASLDETDEPNSKAIAEVK